MLVQRIAVDNGRNRALCGKSMKLGTQVYHPKTLKLRTSAVADLALRGRGNDFHIWLQCPQNLGVNGLQILLSYFSTNIFGAEKNIEKCGHMTLDQ